jgi:membrane protein
MSVALEHAAKRPGLLTRAFARVVARELSKGRHEGQQDRQKGSDQAKGTPGKKEDAGLAGAAEPGRGRQADHPGEIPPRGWKDILKRVWDEIGNDRVMPLSAGMTYFSLMALFPAIGALVSLYGLFADRASINQHLDLLSGVLPAGALQVIGDQMKLVASQGDGTLGLAFFGTLLVSLWSANAGMKAMFDSLNLVYGEKEKRSFIKLNALSLGFTLAMLVLILVAMGGVVVLPVVLKYLWLDSFSEILIKLLRWPIMFLGVALALACIYRYGPSRERPKWRWVTPGSAVAAVGWIAVSVLFSWYAENFASYNETYGSLGAIMGFMVWIWLSGTVVLVGAELDAEMEHQTAKDSTTGKPKPLGGRGATMADTVGPAKA